MCFRLDLPIHSHPVKRTQYKCIHCKRKFKTCFKLTQHSSRCKRKNAKRTYIRAHPHQPASNFTCDICGSTLKKYQFFLEHMNQVHLSKSIHKCQICGRNYPSRYYLTKHLKRHQLCEIPAQCTDEMRVNIDLDAGLMERAKYIRGPNRRIKTYQRKDHEANSNVECELVDGSLLKKELTDVVDEHVMEEFKCEKCSKTFQKFYLLTEHKRYVHSLDNGFRCKKCGRRYPSRYYLSKHMKLHDLNRDLDENMAERKPYVRNHPHQPKSHFICDLCGTVLKQYDSLKEHMISKHSSKDSFECMICNRFYPNRYYLQKHTKRHKSNKDTYDANLDENLMERNRYIKVHPHRPTSNFTCDICQKVVSSYYSMKKHMRSRHTEKFKIKHPCPICSRIFASEQRLSKHMGLRHAKSSKAAKIEDRSKQMCSICGRLFAERSKMLAHEMTHSGIMVSCEVCGKQFLHKNYLRIHVKTVHSQVKPFSCNIDGCKWTFAYPQVLKRHQARRHGVPATNRNACPICSKEFPDSSYHLKRHLKAHANNTAKEYVPKPSGNQSQLEE